MGTDVWRRNGTQLASFRRRGNGSNMFPATAATLVVALVCVIAAPVSGLEGPNVCVRDEPYTTTTRVSERKAYQVREHTWCFNIPPRCSKYKLNFKTVYKTQASFYDIQKYSVVYLLKSVSLGQHIIRSESCPEGHWGPDCHQLCQCRNNASCDPYSGMCHCTQGWRGTFCDEECPPSHYGQDCSEECRCQNGGSCHHISGACHCAPGWTGSLSGKDLGYSSLGSNRDELITQGTRAGYN
ncbi:multiple epidermal growth factor-like domains protein 10 [Schistocerca nitens]|uniref:multiple epidermal growth factor-like domains protein 10 n=1 Tax=Schistocerca nitens TaxID=7011 RepID=UPI002118A282|nr:multiple epidermal growth factor-like domains protein 10 [Schistocerca nitens]